MTHSTSVPSATLDLQLPCATPSVCPSSRYRAPHLHSSTCGTGAPFLLPASRAMLQHLAAPSLHRGLRRMPPGNAVAPSHDPHGTATTKHVACTLAVVTGERNHDAYPRTLCSGLLRLRRAAVAAFFAVRRPALASAHVPMALCWSTASPRCLSVPSHRLAIGQQQLLASAAAADRAAPIAVVRVGNHRAMLPHSLLRAATPLWATAGSV